MEQNYLRDSTSSTSYKDGIAYREVTMVEVEHSGRKFNVCALFENEAKAKISREYGFEYNAIRIEGTCWYEATDMNYFRFSVNGWHYEVLDFERLEIVDSDSKGSWLKPAREPVARTITISVEGGCVQNVYATAYSVIPTTVELLDFDAAAKNEDDPDAITQMREHLKQVDGSHTKIY